MLFFCHELVEFALEELIIIDNSVEPATILSVGTLIVRNTLIDIIA